jgi:hypothetical protein
VEATAGIQSLNERRDQKMLSVKVNFKRLMKPTAYTQQIKVLTNNHLKRSSLSHI